MSQHHHSTREDKRLLAGYRDECAAADAPCWICKARIDYSLPSGQGLPESFERDHYFPASTHPDLYNDPSNWRPSHALCNGRRSNGAPSPGLGETVDAWWL